MRPLLRGPNGRERPFLKVFRGSHPAGSGRDQRDGGPQGWSGVAFRCGSECMMSVSRGRPESVPLSKDGVIPAGLSAMRAFGRVATEVLAR